MGSREIGGGLNGGKIIFFRNCRDGYREGVDMVIWEMAGV